MKSASSMEIEKRASLNGMEHSEKPSIGNTIDAQVLK